MRRVLLTLLVTLACGLTLAASASSRDQGAGERQTSASPTSSQITGLLAEAEKARLALRFDEAHARINEAEALAERSGDKAGLARAHRMKGSVLAWAGQSNEGMTWLSRALAESEAIGDRRGMASALMGLTSAAISEGQTSRANEFGERAVVLLKELGDESGRATVLVNLAAASDQTRADDPRFDEVLAVAARLGDDNLRAAALKARGGRQFTGGDLAGAKATLEAATAAYRRSADVSGEAASYVMLGRIFRAHSDVEGALAQYERAIDLLTPTSERRTLIEAVNSKGVALAAMGRHAEAIAAYEQGLVFARETGNARYIDFMLGNLGGGLGQAGEYAKAVPVLLEVISRKPEPYIAAFRYAQLANAYAFLGRFADALEPINESIRITRELNQIDRLDGRFDDRAWILTGLGRFEDALVDSRAALAVVDQIRAKLVAVDFLKRGYGDQVQRYYGRAVDLLNRLGRGPEALGLAEQGRARALLDLLAARESSSFSLATRSAVGDVATSFSLGSDTIAQPLSIDGVRGVARRQNATLLVYWVNDENTVVWTVDPNGQTWSTTLPVRRARLAELVTATTAPLRTPARQTGSAAGTTPSRPAPVDSGADQLSVPLRGLGLLALTRDDRAAWRELNRVLIDPVRAHLPARGGRVTIIPHGPLSKLAFGALQTMAGRYLIEDFDLSLAPSVSVLAFTGRRQDLERAAPPGPWMLVGNPAVLPEVGGHTLAPLPGAASELRAIAALAPGGNVVRLDANSADEDALAVALASAHPSVVHFATHGFVLDDPKTPPFLVMNRRGDAAAQDGRLTMDEIYDLGLSTDLVVLSACRTGAGAISSDGVVGLARAFFYAGTPSVMATLWDVPDATTAILMSKFYRGYAATRAKSASLRAAQLALLADLRAGRVSVTSSGERVALPEHPLLWAGFVVIGEPGNAQPKSTNGGHHDR